MTKRLSRKRQVEMAFWVYNYAAQVMAQYGVPPGFQVPILDVLWGLSADQRVKVRYPADPFGLIGTKVRPKEPAPECTCALGNQPPGFTYRLPCALHSPSSWSWTSHPSGSSTREEAP